LTSKRCPVYHHVEKEEKCCDGKSFVTSALPEATQIT
jgi:hypothetical protein